MRLSLTCPVCTASLKWMAAESMRVELQDDGVYELTCSQGHITRTVLQNPKFEVLFDIGANAILDGYCREAVSSFASSLERFYEFAIRVLAVNSQINEAQFKKGWAAVAAQSERQYGAFVFLWLFHVGEIPKLPETWHAKFRNDVIHNGKIPHRDEAIRFGDGVLNVIRPMLRVLREKFERGTSHVIVADLLRRHKIDDKPNSTLGMSTILGASIDMAQEHHQLSLSDHLAQMSGRRARV